MLNGNTQQINVVGLLGRSWCECHRHPGTPTAEGDGDRRTCPSPSVSIASTPSAVLGGWLGKAVRRIRPGGHNNGQASLFLI